MICWIASYPKSGNTWLRALISSYYYSKDGFFSPKLLKNIGQFPEKIHFEGFNYKSEIIADTSRLWIKAQEKINQDKKIKFFKTHNIYGAINGNNFTDNKNTVACIYVVRDPRNVITSLKNHYELKYDDALEFMTSERRYIYDHAKGKDYSDFQFISSWEKNFRSWKNQDSFPIKFIKYEDLLNETFFVFKDVIEFIDKVFNNKNSFSKKKAQNAIQSTSFNKLKLHEEKFGFSESVISRADNNKIPFFYLGPDNNWKKFLDKNLQDKVNSIFHQSLIDLSYI